MTDYDETRSPNPALDFIERAANALEVSTSELVFDKTERQPRIDDKELIRNREKVANLPRRQQDKVVEFVSAFVRQQSQKQKA